VIRENNRSINPVKSIGDILILSREPQIRQLISSPALLLAFGFGSGLVKKAPGTLGTLAAVPFWYLLSNLTLTAYVVIIYLATVIGIIVCEKASTKLGVHDHGGIVWDEFVGFWIAMCPVSPSAINLVVGFILFRGLDIFKPWPISWLDQNIHGGLGIMLDDIAAGLVTAMLMVMLGNLGLL